VDSNLSGIEQAIFGQGADRAAVDSWLDRHIQRSTGARVAELLFTSGRVSAVFGARLTDGEDVVAKVHRGPVDVSGLSAAQSVQHQLWRAGFPCPEPIGAPHSTDGHVATLETLTPPGRSGDGRDHRTRPALATGLARQVALLRDNSTGPRLAPPAWTRWRHGPWPTPHDPIFDFGRQEPRWAWIDRLAERAVRALQDLDHDLGKPTIAHGDWSCVNTSFSTDGSNVVSSYDWDSLAYDSEAVLAGMSAGSSLQGGATESPACPTPEEIDSYLDDYSSARQRPFTTSERQAGRAAAHWVLAYNARCQAALLGPDRDPEPGSTLHVLHHDRTRYSIS
jgi:hypothetical protein